MLFTVPAGNRALRIFFRDLPSADNYLVSASPDWNTKVTIANKKVSGFVLRFKDPAPPEGGVVSIDVPGLQIYTAAQMVYEQNQRCRQQWNRMMRNRESAAVNEVQRVQRQREAELREVERRPDIEFARRGPQDLPSNHRIYRCNFCGAEGEGTQWATTHHHATSQTTLSIEQPKHERAKKKKPVQDPRLSALVKATVGGQS